MVHFLAIIRDILTLRDIERCPAFNFLVLGVGKACACFGLGVCLSILVFLDFFFAWIVWGGFVCVFTLLCFLLLCLVLGSFGGSCLFWFFVFCFCCLAGLEFCWVFLLLFFFHKVAKQVRCTPHHCNF